MRKLRDIKVEVPQSDIEKIRDRLENTKNRAPDIIKNVSVFEGTVFTSQLNDLVKDLGSVLHDFKKDNTLETNARENVLRDRVDFVGHNASGDKFNIMLDTVVALHSSGRVLVIGYVGDKLCVFERNVSPQGLFPASVENILEELTGFILCRLCDHFRSL